MVDLSALGNIGNQLINVLILILAFLFFGAIAFGAWFFMQRQKRYSEYKCVIWSRDGTGHINESYDGAGVFVDPKTQNKRLFLKKANVGLDPDNIPYMPTSKGGRVIYLLRTGLKNFHFIKPNIANPNITLTVGEEDVNWGINAYERQKKAFSQNMILQYLPYIALAFVSMIILIIFIYFFKNFDVLKDVAASLNAAAKQIAQAKAGTVVIE